MRPGLDEDVAAVARHIARLGAHTHARVYEMSGWSERVLDWAMSHEPFKTRLFHFVDVFPATTGDEDVVRHMAEYFDGIEIPKPLRLGLGLAEHLPLGPKVAAGVARRNIRRMARQFIAGESAEAAAGRLHRMWRQGAAFTVDLLGEKTVTSREADAYSARVLQVLGVLASQAATWAPDDHLERDDLGALPRVNVSVKTTALSPLMGPLTEKQGLEEAKARLRPVLRRAADLGAFINFDAEHFEVKDLTRRLFVELLAEEGLSGLAAGIALQAYLKDSRRDLEELIALSATRDTPITIRLVKGAYWDTETVLAESAGWPGPVFEDKAQTDANYELCASMLHDAHGKIRAAFGTHNLRSLAAAVVMARDLGIPDHGYEIQMLYGMGEPIQAAVRQMGLRLRVYTPVGSLVPGMAYLVRRLLENTSNESFLRHRFAEGQALEDLIGPPAAKPLTDASPPEPRPATDASSPGSYDPEPVAEWRNAGVRRSFAGAVRRASAAPAAKVPALIGGHDVSTPAVIPSVDPGNPSREIARSACCGAPEGDDALDVALKAWEKWRRTAPERRASVLFAAAQWMRVRRNDLAALEVFEAAKPWREADADVCEAIDFCEYYGRRMLVLAEGGDTQSPPGESNELIYQSRGVGLVISPWNFPLAIPTGMVCAALVCGNAVLFKPSEQTPLVGRQLVDALIAGGLPDGVLSFLPGHGDQVGAHLVRRPEVSFIAFTGSKAVGLGIVKTAAEHSDGQRHVKRVIAEMGGKNALIIDSDADPDQAVPGAVYSAFGYAGQKCSAASRLII
ncbi:MAG: proline dehydrogenase family protein, partial [Actinomycetota bacterium]